MDIIRKVYAETKRADEDLWTYSTTDILDLLDYIGMLQEDNGKLERQVKGLSEQNDERYEVIRKLKRERSRREQKLQNQIIQIGEENKRFQIEINHYENEKR